MSDYFDENIQSVVENPQPRFYLKFSQWIRSTTQPDTADDF